MFRNIKSTINLSVLGILAVLLFFFILSYGTPLNYDDWAWGGELGLSRLNDGFYRNYNGRYAGNTLEIIITRFPLIRYTIMSFSSTTLLLSLGLVSRNRRRLSFLIALALILFMPAGMFNQTFSWIAGFVNYIPGSIFAVWAIIFLKHELLYTPDVSYRGPGKNHLHVIQVLTIFVLFLIGVRARLNQPQRAQLN